MIETNNLTEARGFIEHADRLFSETYPISEDPKLFIPVLKLIRKGLAIIGTDTSEHILATITKTLEAYDDRVVEFPRGGRLVFADDAMQATTLSHDQVLVAINETKRAYMEAYE